MGGGVNAAPALAWANLGSAIGAGTDVAVDTAEVVLMRCDALDVAVANAHRHGTWRKVRQNFAWAVGYNVIALPSPPVLFEPACPERATCGRDGT